MTEAKRPSPLKRKYVIDLKFQGKFIVTAVVPLMVFVLVLAFGFMYAVNSIAREYQFENTAELIQKLSTTLGNDATSGLVFRRLNFMACSRCARSHSSWRFHSVFCLCCSRTASLAR
jgi:hypothetical protein